MNGKEGRNLTVFGGTGDLTYRKLMPAFFNMFATGIITDDDNIIAIGRRDYDTQAYVEIVEKWVKEFARVDFTKEKFTEFAKCVKYCKMDFSDLAEYDRLKEILCGENGTQSVFYYAVAPKFFDVISRGVMKLTCVGEVKIVIEKPFGENLADAEKLNNLLEEKFGTDNIYRIDHYLGKEMVQGLNAVRFNNLIFKESWNNKYIESVKIIASEAIGIGTRAKFYDETGALKDMVQNHLLQILSLVAADEPDEQSLQQKQTEVFKSLRKVEATDVILGQYEGYLAEKDVLKDSTTETFAMCRLYVDTKRFFNVPFYIVTGKKLNNREMKVVITFKSVGGNANNKLIFKIQPFEGVQLEFNIKEPGENKIVSEKMDFCQSCVEVYRQNTPEAYERLLGAILNSDNTLFSSWDHISLCWKFVDELKKVFVDNDGKLRIYGESAKYSDIVNI